MGHRLRFGLAFALSGLLALSVWGQNRDLRGGLILCLADEIG
jgi:hypothetical protein